MTKRVQALHQELKVELDNLRNQHDFPGATVAYVLGDGTVGASSTGFADKEAKIPMTSESRMLAASIGKSFVGATLLSLSQERLLSLNDPIAMWLGDRIWFHRLPNHASITLRHLLTHSSGLQDHVHMKSFLEWYAQTWRKAGNPFPPESLIDFILDQPPLFESGKGWSYTDTGYILLGLIIEAATGNSYSHEVMHRFLRPLHLTMTTPSDQPALPGLVAGYTAPDNPFGLPVKTTLKVGLMAWNPSMEWTGGGLISNSRDLAVWAKLLYEGHAMAGDYLPDLFQSVCAGKEEDGIRYGAGVAIYEKDPMGLTYGHRGVIPGYSSSMRYFPQSRIAFAFQVNTDVGVWDHTSELVTDMECRLAKIITKDK